MKLAVLISCASLVSLMFGWCAWLELDRRWRR